MDKHHKIYIAGHRGMVGSAIQRALQARHYQNLITITSGELDLREQADVDHFFEINKPEYVILAAAKVGGILANDRYKADFIYDNLMIQSNVIHSSHKYGVKKLLFLGSSCIYPKLAPQPLKEEDLLSGPLEPTNEPYAIAKLAGLKMCQAYRQQFGDNFITVLPTSLYGPGDNYHPQNSHVLPGLLRKFHQAKDQGAPQVEVWGTGAPRREFMHVDDLAEACIFLMNHFQEIQPINVGTGQDLSIRELAELIKSVVGYEGQVYYNHSYPDGTPRKLMDISKLQEMGWAPTISLLDGIGRTYSQMKKELFQV